MVLYCFPQSVFFRLPKKLLGFLPFFWFLILCSIWLFPFLYQEGVNNILLRWRRILGWMFNGLCSAAIIFFFCTKALDPQAFSLQIVGAAMFTCVVCVVNCQMALLISYFTLIQHLVIWGGIAFWFLFLVIYGSMPPRVCTTAYDVFLECLAMAPSFWLTTLFVVVSAQIPYYTFSAIQMRFFPMYHEKIRWMSLGGQSDDPAHCKTTQQGSIGLTTVGSTARMEARNNCTEHGSDN